ncbi:MAG: pantetheine-phosphate adenylyltransferase [Prevotellaceae bacterium]|jgi:pantetheine-phosphate adenylyltransferase|nr:pantetheine-phosphate adenylyltransferase [Prevotellaceae bacterium]
MTKTAIFTGSFDPFTIGHQTVVERALLLFDKVIVGIGFNMNKKYLFSTEERVKNISQLFENQPKVFVKTYNCITVDFAKENGADYIIRSVRSAQDFEYEQNMANINKHLSGIETILFFAEQKFAHISSSMVRELIAFGKEVDDFLPKIN